MIGKERSQTAEGDWESALKAKLRQRDLPPLDELSESRLREGLLTLVATPEGLVGTSLELFLEQQQSAAWNRVFRVLRGRARNQLQSCDVPSGLLAPEDLAQATLSRAQETLRQFRGNSEGEFFGWLFRIQNHLCVDWIRRLHRGDGAELRAVSVDQQCEAWSSRGAVAVPDPRAGTPSEAARGNEAIVKLYDAIEQLPQPQRDVVTAKMAELKFEEIARRTGMPKTTVIRRYQDALKSLKSVLEGLQ